MKKLIKFIAVFAVLAGVGYYFYDKNFNVPQVDQFITSKAVRGELVKSIESNGEIYATELIKYNIRFCGNERCRRNF